MAQLEHEHQGQHEPVTETTDTSNDDMDNCELSPLCFQFARVGWYLGRAPALALLCVAALAAALATGLGSREKMVDSDLFDSLLLRPKTRLQRESDWVEKYEDSGFSSGSEAVNARATSGGKNILTRSNLMQAVNFFEDAGIHDIQIEYRSVNYATSDVLSFAGPSQPYRFSVLDCYQEGVYDYVGDVTPLGASASLVQSVVNEFMAPFLDDGASVRVTPYNWCLYLRVGIVYAPSTAFDAYSFGRCRQFLREDPGSEYVPLERAYDFHRFLAYDWARSSPSSYLPWGCQVALRNENSCHPYLSCCEVSSMYAACASCETYGDCSNEFAWEDPDQGSNSSSTSLKSLLPRNVSVESCDLLQELLGIDSWESNPNYSIEYATKPSCKAFDYYPLSSLYAASIGAAEGAQIAESTDLSDCSERQGDFEVDTDQLAIVEFAVTELYCKMFGGDSTCPSSLSTVDFDWRFKEVAVATEEQLNAIAASGRCAHWDGGPDGSLNLLPYISLQIILGDISQNDDGTYETKALQVVHVSNGYKTIRNAYRNEKGIDVSTNDAKNARIQYLIKFANVMHGRHDGKSLVFGTYSSGGGGGAQRSAVAQLVPETHLVLLAYCLIIVYSLSVFISSGEPTSLRRVFLDGGLAIVGVALVFAGLAAGMGTAVRLGIKFNPVSIQVLPFLVLGLGINDLYVYSHRYFELLPLFRGGSPIGNGAALTARVAADAGASVSITTCANICVFSVAASTIKMRMIAHFSYMAACALAGTWICITFGYTAALAIHCNLVFRESLTSIDDATLDKALGVTAAAEQPNKGTTITNGGEQAVNGTSRRERATQYARRLTQSRRTATCTIVLVAIAFAVIAGIGLPLVELNYAVNYIFPRRSSEDIFWRTKLKYLNSNFFDIHTGRSDFARKHPLLATSRVEGTNRYSLMQQIVSAKKVIKTNQESWYNVFISWNMACGSWSFASGDVISEADVASKCETSAWYAPLGGAYNSRCSPDDALTVPFAGACGPVVSTSYLSQDEFRYTELKAQLFSDPENDLSTALVPACTAWPVQHFLCDGEPCFGPNELTKQLYDQVISNATLVYGVHPRYYYECFNLFLQHDEAHALRSPLFNCHDPKDMTKRISCAAIPQAERMIWRGPNGDKDMDFSQTIVWAANLKTGVNWLKMISSLRRKLNDFVSRTGVDAYPHGSFWFVPVSRIIETFYYQFAFIKRAIIESFGYSALAIFVLTFAFFFSAQNANIAKKTRLLEAGWLSLLVCIGVSVQVVLFIAIMGLVELWLNSFTMATVIVSFGIAIEGVAHTAFGYLAATGEAQHRATTAIDRYFMPITDGAFTTFLGFAPIAGSRYLYVVLYYFLIYAILVLVSYFIGVVFFPALLSTLGLKSLSQDKMTEYNSKLSNSMVGDAASVKDEQLAVGLHSASGPYDDDSKLNTSETNSDTL